jgi:hypothetical protein
MESKNISDSMPSIETHQRVFRGDWLRFYFKYALDCLGRAHVEESCYSSIAKRGIMLNSKRDGLGSLILQFYWPPISRWRNGPPWCYRKELDLYLSSSKKV